MKLAIEKISICDFKETKYYKILGYYCFVRSYWSASINYENEYIDGTVDDLDCDTL